MVSLCRSDRFLLRQNAYLPCRTCNAEGGLSRVSLLVCEECNREYCKRCSVRPVCPRCGCDCPHCNEIGVVDGRLWCERCAWECFERDVSDPRDYFLEVWRRVQDLPGGVRLYLLLFCPTIRATCSSIRKDIDSALRNGLCVSPRIETYEHPSSGETVVCRKIKGYTHVVVRESLGLPIVFGRARGFWGGAERPLGSLVTLRDVFPLCLFAPVMTDVTLFSDEEKLVVAVSFVMVAFFAENRMHAHAYEDGRQHVSVHRTGRGSATVIQRDSAFVYTLRFDGQKIVERVYNCDDVLHESEDEITLDFGVEDDDDGKEFSAPMQTIRPNTLKLGAHFQNDLTVAYYEEKGKGHIYVANE